jgi:hypothetical protein
VRWKRCLSENLIRTIKRTSLNKRQSKEAMFKEKIDPNQKSTAVKNG